MEERNCQNCWWNGPGGCKFSLELRQLQPDYKPSDKICWAWRPTDRDEKLKFLEKYGREVDRIGKFPNFNLS